MERDDERRVVVAIRWDSGAESAFADTIADEWIERIVAAAAAAAPARARIAGPAGVAVLMSDDATLRELNRQFRGRDEATDVLSFEGSALDGGAAMAGMPVHLGDVAISLERAHRQAAEYGHSFEREVAYLLVHGTLHLLGYDHETAGDLARMRQAEEAVLGSAGQSRDEAAV